MWGAKSVIDSWSVESSTSTPSARKLKTRWSLPTALSPELEACTWRSADIHPVLSMTWPSTASTWASAAVRSTGCPLSGQVSGQTLYSGPRETVTW
jgi:hypothetical protein